MWNASISKNLKRFKMENIYIFAVSNGNVIKEFNAPSEKSAKTAIEKMRSSLIRSGVQYELFVQRKCIELPMPKDVLRKYQSYWSTKTPRKRKYDEEGEPIIVKMLSKEEKELRKKMSNRDYGSFGTGRNNHKHQMNMNKISHA